MLARSRNRTAAVIIFDLWSNGSFPQLSAFGVIIFGLLILLVSIGQAGESGLGFRSTASLRAN
jgi:hypothetical protein